MTPLAFKMTPTPSEMAFETQISSFLSWRRFFLEKKKILEKKFLEKKILEKNFLEKNFLEKNFLEKNFRRLTPAPVLGLKSRNQQ